MNEQKMTQEVEELRQENSELRELLDKKYPVEQLALIGAVSLMASVLSLFYYFSLGVTIIHPYIAIVILVGSAGLCCLAHWRKSYASK